MEIQGHSVFGYFNDWQEAEEAKRQLLAAGFNDTQLDTTGHESKTDASTNPLAGTPGGLGTMVMGVDPGDDNAGVLLAADASASGLAGKGLGEPGKAWLVVTVTDGTKEKVKEAVRIMEEAGGQV